MIKNFIIIGVGGYVAPRHLRAIHELGHSLVAAMDPNDSVGILDRYFPNCQFFTSEKNLSKFLEGFIKSGETVDYFIICSPNYLHRKHIELGVRFGADVICEKPLVLDSEDITALEKLRSESIKEIFTILQLRLHPQIKAIQSSIQESPEQHRSKVQLTYITGRGPWYQESWKGDMDKSGGIVCNIGIHLFDMLLWIFGSLVNSETHILNDTTASGTLTLERADVNWYLSIDGSIVPVESDKRMYRSLVIDSNTFDFTVGFENLHTESYDKILNQDEGYTINDVKNSIQLVETITKDTVTGPQPHGHKLTHK
ncbi:Gfo/Idh/MocA family oxidoreductase [Saprospiraceae bacterium]|nr:Gfo/Idh/MocA family oxidoreductase [Saprospiraceae bacterium]